ncbi:GH92 family glycosyl hydrolase [Actinocrinis puniceicyclus]|uniref:GH92 family glycosyl hydrolase n=1 Tax=Actinocrinis puniceicyclus TaxID=977794 RepID=A0A8J8BBG7_9ACTN|nr:GH92 family glycosyl hydrolase [Actinocrinis puniceicyclus]MBS2963113.1 GH92 family glycosyl hydrolase [Actinocrinis puniceicyclus]
MAGATTDPARLVDTRTWTTNGGNTFPGAIVPFGEVQWSPDTMPDRNAGGGYAYGDSALTGYSLTHVSGPGCGAAGDVPILPLTGALTGGDPNGATTSFTNTGEVAQAGYYSAESNLPRTITSEFTATAHSSMGRFTFPATTRAGFLVKLMDAQNTVTSTTAQVVGTDEVAGSQTSGGFCGDPAAYTVYFDLVFDHSFTASQVLTDSGQKSPAAVFLTFDTTASQVVQAKVGISYVSTANAALNRQKENSGWNFGAVRSAAQKSWNGLLGRIAVSGGAADKTQQFYSNLYKVFVQPNITSDVNGQYLGSDGKVHTVAGPQKNQYGMFSGWDTYHGTSQLQAMLDPSAASDQAQSLINYYNQNGVLQQWGYLNLDNYVMNGDPADAIIADYYAFGAHGFATGAALTDMVKQATTVNDVRPEQAAEQQYGYLPEDGTYGCCNPHGFVSSLLEYDNADFALAQYAAALGDSADATTLQNRANNWVNVFDTSTGLLTPRLKNGAFLSGITPTTSAHYVEGDAYEYLWDVPNDYAGLISLLGGNTKVAPELEDYLSQPNAGGMYGFLANEFDLGEQYAPDYAGDPAGTQQAVNNIRNSVYTPGPAGLDNNDDLGAMSAQYVWEMLGMYPENPGSGNLVFASPGFPSATVNLPNGKKVSITAPGASPTDFYVKALKLNGRAYNKLYTSFSTLSRGATLAWTLSKTPTGWGTAAADAPPSYGPVFGATGSVDPSSVVLEPGQSSTATLAVQSTDGTAQTVTWTADPAPGVTVTPSSGSLAVAAGGSAGVSVTVVGGATDGVFPVTFKLTSTAGNVIPAQLSVVVARPGDLVPFFTVNAISDDGDPAAANYDGDGWSYSQQALTAAGLAPGASVTSGGLTYTWPNVAAGTPDAILAAGQTIALDAPAGATRVGFLGSATNAGGSGSQGTVTVAYTDGTTSTATLGYSDWTLGGGGGTPQFGNVIVATTPYRNGGNGKQNISTFIFAQTIPVDGSKTVASITLPGQLNQGAIGVFAIAAG